MAISILGCGGDSGELGDECDLDDDESCAVDLVCASAVNGESGGDGVCAYPTGAACDPAAEGVQCAPELVCAEVRDGEDPHVCFARVWISGSVFDGQTTDAIEGSHVIALDEQATAVTDVAVTDVDGLYSLEVPDVVRDPEGKPLSASYTLRASAADYRTFPGGLRTALPINAADAVDSEDGWMIENPLTSVALLALPEEERGAAVISGKILADTGTAGVLVVADNQAGAFSGLSDAGGNYTVFNVPDGEYTVQGYAAGLQLDPVATSVAGTNLEGVDLSQADAPLATISGSINIVNAPGGSATSVILVVASTFDDTFVRGEVPRGLRTPLVGTPDVTGGWTIPDVPDGDYVVLAAFEDDLLVRDPDPNIAGTQIVTVSVPDPADDREITLDTSFKITEALAVVGPGVDVPEAVTGTPTLTWVDDSSEDYYSVVVYNSFGDLVWEDPMVPRVTGADNVEVEYAGPPLERGVYYQFRATSWRESGGDPGPISTTEDLRGVFYLE